MGVSNNSNSGGNGRVGGFYHRVLNHPQGPFYAVVSTMPFILLAICFVGLNRTGYHQTEEVIPATDKQKINTVGVTGEGVAELALKNVHDRRLTYVEFINSSGSLGSRKDSSEGR